MWPEAGSGWTTSQSGRGRSFDLDQAVLTDVLNLAKIEAGSLTLEAMSFEPRVLARDLEGIFGPQAAAARLELSVHVDSGGSLQNHSFPN